MALFGSKKDPRERRCEKLARKYKDYLIEESVHPLMNGEFMAQLLTGTDYERQHAREQLSKRPWESRIMSDADALAAAWLDWQGSTAEQSDIRKYAETLQLHPGVYKDSENRFAVEAATPIIQEAFVQACRKRMEQP